MFFSLMPLLFIANAYAVPKDIIVQTNSVKVRSGAGNYYEVLYIANKGAKLEILEENDRWIKVRLPDGATGFVSKKALNRKPEKETARRYDKYDTEGVGKVASSEIMAATKGVMDIGAFAKRYAKNHKIDPSIFEELDDAPFSAPEYNVFKGTLSRKNRVRVKGMNRGGIEEYDRDIGEAIALRLSAAVIDKDRELRKYVSMVGTAVTDNTPLYDETFVFIVLESDEIASFAAPGGYIFITRGALAHMNNEAELAGVLGHEIIHVVQKHGIKEIEKQKTRIDSSKMMESLDEELTKLKMDKGNEKLYRELDQMTDEMYELITSGRKRKSEDESDSLGTLIMYNTGYRAEGLKTFIVNTGKVEEKNKGKSYSHHSADARASHIDVTIKKYRLNDKYKGTFEERFQKNGKNLSRL